MRLAFVSLFTMLLCFSTHLFGELRLEKISELHRMEAFRGHLAQDGFVFIGKRFFGNSGHQLVLLNAKTEKEISEVDLPHSARGLHSLGKDRVLVVGALSNPWRTFATEVSSKGGQLKIIKTHAIPTKYQVDKFALVGKKWFFNERGDRAIVSKFWRSYKKLPLEISGPDDMIGIGDELWAIEGRGIGHGDESLLVYNTRSKTSEKLLLQSIGKRGINSIIALEDLGLVVIDDAVGGRLIAIDSATRKPKLELAIGDDIRSIARYGMCIAALRTEAKEIVWTKLTDDQKFIELARWDISSGGQNLDNPLEIAVESGKAFVRSSKPCIFCDPATNFAGVFVAEDSEIDLENECL